jgi:hypothetical protein
MNNNRALPLTSDYSILLQRFNNDKEGDDKCGTIFTIVSELDQFVAWDLRLPPTDRTCILLNCLMSIGWYYEKNVWDASIKMDNSDLLLILHGGVTETIRFQRVPRYDAVLASVLCNQGKERHRKHIEQHQRDQECHLCILL